MGTDFHDRLLPPISVAAKGREIPVFWWKSWWRWKIMIWPGCVVILAKCVFSSHLVVIHFRPTTPELFGYDDLVQGCCFLLWGVRGCFPSASCGGRFVELALGSDHHICVGGMWSWSWILGWSCASSQNRSQNIKWKYPGHQCNMFTNEMIKCCLLKSFWNLYVASTYFQF